MRRVVIRGLILAAALAASVGCGDREGERPPANRAAPARSGAALPPAPVQLVDSSIAPAVAGQDGWNYQQIASADFDGDGAEERVVLTARVELIRGRPAWDDGQPWQIYIEEREGQRTHIYARRVQLGTVTARVGVSEAGRNATVVIVEHLPDEIGLYEVTYAGPGRSTTREIFRRTLDPRGDAAAPRLP